MVSSQRYKSRYEFIHLLHYNNSHHFAQFILTPSYSVITVEKILESHLSLSHTHTHTHTPVVIKTKIQQKSRQSYQNKQA